VQAGMRAAEIDEGHTLLFGVRGGVEIEGEDHARPLELDIAVAGAECPGVHGAAALLNQNPGDVLSVGADPDESAPMEAFQQQAAVEEESLLTVAAAGKGDVHGVV